MDTYAVIIAGQIVNTIQWDGTTPWTPPLGATIMLLETALADGYAHAPRPPSVPDSLSPTQLRIWLLRAGKLEQVNTLIASDPDPLRRTEKEQRWDYALAIPRSHPLVLEIGEALGMTDEEMDDAFIQAASL